MDNFYYLALLKIILYKYTSFTEDFDNGIIKTIFLV